MFQRKVSVIGVSFNLYSEFSELENIWKQILQGLWEPQTFRILRNLLDETHCALEVGIDLGQTTMFTSSVAGRLIAIEPSVDCIHIVEKHLKSNPALLNKTTLIHGALANLKGKLFFGKGSTLFDDIHFESHDPKAIVDGYTIEDIEEIAGKKITFINMDIEGGEFVVLGSMISWLRIRKPILLLSLHPGFLLTDKWRERPLFIRYIKRIIEQKKIYMAIRVYPYIYDAITLKRVFPFTIFRFKYVRSRSAHNSQILCLNFKIQKSLKLKIQDISQLESQISFGG